MLGINDKPSSQLIEFIAQQLNPSASAWELYGSRKNTFHDHQQELQTIFGFKGTSKNAV